MVLVGNLSFAKVWGKYIEFSTVYTHALLKQYSCYNSTLIVSGHRRVRESSSVCIARGKLEGFTERSFGTSTPATSNWETNIP